jgi:hypothetical protein
MEREILKAALAPGDGCLDLERLGRYADGVLPAAEQAAADAHVHGCLNCQAELALMRAITSGASESPSRRWLRSGMAPLAAAAAVALVVAGSFLLRAKAPELPSATTGPEVTRSLAVGVRAPLGDQAEAPRRFEWTAAAGAARYRVRLLEVDRREVWSTSTAGLVAELPPDVRATMAPGRTFLWEVTAYDTSGAVIGESGPQAFHLVLR